MFTYIKLKFMVNVGKYYIYGAHMGKSIEINM